MHPFLKPVCSLSLALSLCSLAGCRDLYEAKRPYQVYAQDASYFAPLLNAPKSETLVTLVNEEYPIELKLYKDRTFHYHLAKLGDGIGEWKYKDGHVELYAERTLFVMRMEMHSVSADAAQEAISLEFSDRFGPKFLPLVKK